MRANYEYDEVTEGIRSQHERNSIANNIENASRYLQELLPDNWAELDDLQREIIHGQLDLRLAELNPVGVPCALDHDFLRGCLEPTLSYVSEMELLEAPSDFYQVEWITDYIERTEWGTFDAWRELTVDQKLEALNDLEQTAARIGHRPTAFIELEKLPEKHRGHYNYGTNTITLNKELLEASSRNPEAMKTVINTILHEGRHAYQNYNVYVRSVHPDLAEVCQWRQNLENYRDPKIWGYPNYYKQPVEIDARNFAGNIVNRIFA